MESEIFGHVKGAFTGANTERQGAVALADGGTLFLDELCEMDLDLQSKFLRFIQSSRYKKVGGSKFEEVDIRIICATNRNPLEEVKAAVEETVKVVEEKKEELKAEGLWLIQ